MDGGVKGRVHTHLGYMALAPEGDGSHAKDSGIKCVVQVQAMPESSEVVEGDGGAFCTQCCRNLVISMDMTPTGHYKK